MYDLHLSSDAASVTGRTRWWRALWLAASAGPASPVLQAMAGPNGVPLWSGASKVLTGGLPCSAASDVYADDDSADVVAESTTVITTEDLCQAA